MRKILLIGCLFSLILGTFVNASTYIVGNAQEYNQISKSLNPGDSIILRNGIWTDFVIRFAAEGTSENPVVLMAENPGEVIITGRSALLLSGNYLNVSGLSFVNGSTPEEAVISFRNAIKGKVANNSRVTDCKIENFGLKNRWDSDNYVALWGKHNRVDHNYFGKKDNLGVTLVVYLKGEENWPNHHVIDFNHFGPRERLGSNGGETIRFGVSSTSLNSSFTVLENNLFEQCNGETEIVSIKSSDNIIRNNLFFESEGSLVLRHGNRNQVENNVFIGNFKPYTGGIRLVNYGHRIKGNLLLGLTGDGFRAPLSIMCGLENSPLNRYEPVKDVTIDGNVWLACSNGWDIGVPFTRSDTEGDFVLPADVTISNNVVWQNHSKPLVNYLTGKANLLWEHNLTNSVQTDNRNNEFRHDNFELQQLKNVILPQAKSSSGSVLENIQNVFLKVSDNKFGPSFNSVSGESLMSRTVLVAPGSNTINNALHSAQEVDDVSLVLISGFDYLLEESAVLKNRVSIASSSWISGDRKHPALSSDIDRAFLPHIKPMPDFKDLALFVVNGSAEVSISGVNVSGQYSESQLPVRYGFLTSKENMYGDYRFSFEGVHIDKFTHDNGAIFKGSKESFARKLEVRHSLFEKSLTGLVFDEETEDEGKYNIEELYVVNTAFRNFRGTVFHLYRGGMDESTFGPFLYVDNCEFVQNYGNGNQSLFNLTGVQVVKIHNSHFNNNQNYGRLMHLKGAKNSIIRSSVDRKDIISTENNAVIDNILLNSKRFEDSRKTGLINYPL